jgi:ABC-type multidrug transport system ATPase subunit
MTIRLSDAGKRFNREWIFRHASLEFTTPGSYAITGPNGSGKSTLLQTIGGLLQPSEGKVTFQHNDTLLATEKVYQHISFCAPYMEVVEEMTLVEFLLFHQSFKAFLPGFDVQKIIAETGLEKAANKQVRHYSSGMKQRVKLAQAIFSNVPIVLLDEPCSNLDAQGIALYKLLIQTYCTNRLVIVSSNDPAEYSFCTNIISINDFKQLEL